MKKKLPIIIIVIAVIVAFSVYFFVIKPGNDTEKTQQTQLEEMYYYIPGDYFVTNVKDSPSLCKTSVSLALTGGDKTPFLETSNAIVRNAIVKVLINHTEEELRDPGSIAMLEGEMKSAITSALQLENELQNVYISDFVIQ